ncbi:MAG TPA: hypothetical protein VGF79_07330 [Bacteroidia bacterium]
MFENSKTHACLISRTGTLLFFLIVALFITGLWLPRNWGHYGNNDWDLTYMTYEIARASIVEHREWPLYNPYLAFGSDVTANPQSVVAGIFMLPVLLFGTFYGLKVSLLLAILLGLFGMRALILKINPNPLIALMIAVLFCSSAYLGRHIVQAGHSNFMYFYLFPFLFSNLLNFKLHGNRFSLLIAVLILSQFITGGAPFLFIVASITLGLWLVGLLIIHKDTKMILPFVIVMLAGFGISVWKVLPVMDFWSQSPRLVNDDSSINLLVWLNALEDNPTNTGTPHGWHEFAIGIGILLPLLIVYFHKKIIGFKIWLILFLVVLWISLGNVPDHINPWYLIHHFLPVFDGLRAPSRFGFILMFAMLIGLGICLKNENDNKLVYLILIAITFSSTLNYNSLSRNLSLTPRIDEITPSGLAPNSVVRSDDKFNRQFPIILNKGILVNAYEPLHLEPVTDTLGQFITGANLKSLSCNNIAFKMTKDTALLCLRYDKNWQTNSGQIEKTSDGLLSVTIKAGTEVDMNYYNPKIDKGLVISICSFIAFLITLVFLKRKSPLTADTK